MSNEITLITDGAECYVQFINNDPNDPFALYVYAKDVPDLKAKAIPTGFKEGQNNLFRYATDPRAALKWMLENGWQAHSEEQDWLDTGLWPNDRRLTFDELTEGMTVNTRFGQAKVAKRHDHTPKRYVQLTGEGNSTMRFYEDQINGSEIVSVTHA